MRRIIYLIISLIFVVNLSAQQIDKSKIDKFIKEARERLKLKTGLAVSVVIDDQIVFSEAYGYANIEEEIEATPDSPFYIASAGKSFMSTLTQILTEKDTLNIDKPISYYLPAYEFEDQSLRSNLITIRDMLSHRSGIDNIPVKIRTSYTGQYDNQTLLNLYKFSRFTTPEFNYTNDGFIFTSLILEKMYNQSWRELIKNYLLTPLQMKNTSTRVSHFDPGLLQAYSTKKGSVKNLSFLKKDNTMSAAGGIVTTANDLGNWLIFNINGGKFNNEQLLPKRKVDELHSSQISCDKKFWAYDRFAYGLGWYLSDYRDELLIHHFGSFSGSRSHISFMPKYKIGVSALTNDDGDAYYLADLVADYIYNLFLGKDAEEIAQKELKPLIDKMNSYKKEMDKPAEDNMVKSIWDADQLLGTYTNKTWGEIEINNDGKLIFNWGNIQSDLVPATEKLFVTYAGPFKARVEFVEDEGMVRQLNLIGPGKLEFIRK